MLNDMNRAVCAKPFDQYQGDLKCKKVNWVRSFDKQGWSKCPKGYYLQSFYKSSCQNLHCIEYANCCKNEYDGGYASCYNENIDSAFDRPNAWAKCKREGFFIAGMKRTKCDQIHCLTRLRCCNPVTTFWAQVNDVKVKYTEYNHNWWSSFDRKGWSKCKKGFFISGFYRNKCNQLYCLEEAQCKKPSYLKAKDVECKTANWWKSFNKKGFSNCPEGYFLSGLWRSSCNKLYCLEQGHCCKDKAAPKKWTNCYNENVWSRFDRKGWSYCTKPGYYIAGLFRNNCEKLFCIEEFKCCTFDQKQGYY